MGLTVVLHHEFLWLDGLSMAQVVNAINLVTLNISTEYFHTLAFGYFLQGVNYFGFHEKAFSETCHQHPKASA